MSRSLVVAAARGWIGTPYHHRARLKNAGVDCGQILIAVYSEVGLIEEFDPESYPADWMMHKNQERYLKNIETYAKKVSREPRPGDIALFRFGRCISHGGIVTEWPSLVHAYKPAGMVIEENIETNFDLKNRFVGTWSVFRE